MTGLLVKDYKLLKNQRTFFILMVLIAFGTLTSMQNTYGISYATFVFTLFTISTISYDEMDNGFLFLFTLPVTRELYVKEKYLFGGINCILTWIIASGVTYIYLLKQNIQTDLSEFLIADLFYLLIAAVFLAVILPIQLKFGAEKGRLAFVAFFGILFILLFSIFRVIQYFGLSEKLSQLDFSGIKIGAVLLASILITLGIILGSLKVSIRIMKKKAL